MTNKTLKIERHWCMPNKHTFKMEPIAILLKELVGDGKDWLDPFAGFNSPAEFTNDLNPSCGTYRNQNAIEFVQWFAEELCEWKPELTGVLFDPPYSPRQITECYQGFGLKASAEDTSAMFGRVKDIVARVVVPGGYAISFGWNSNGFGRKLGFYKEQILLIAHGGNHNDTIVTVERKFTQELHFVDGD